MKNSKFKYIYKISINLLNIIIGLIGLSCVIYICASIWSDLFRLKRLDSIYIINLPVLIWFTAHSILKLYNILKYRSHEPINSEVEIFQKHIIEKPSDSSKNRRRQILINNNFKICLLYAICLADLTMCCFNFFVTILYCWIFPVLVIIISSIIGIVANIKLFMFCVQIIKKYHGSKSRRGIHS